MFYESDCMCMKNLTLILYHSLLCTEQLIYVFVLSKLLEGTKISAFRYINLNGTVTV